MTRKSLDTKWGFCRHRQTDDGRVRPDSNIRSDTKVFSSSSSASLLGNSHNTWTHIWRSHVWDVFLPHEVNSRSSSFLWLFYTLLLFFFLLRERRLLRLWVFFFLNNEPTTISHSLNFEMYLIILFFTLYSKKIFYRIFCTAFIN